MAVKSAADKTGGHKSTGQKTKSYSAAPVTPPPAQGITPSGQKALMFRARKELSALADPTQSPAD